MAAAPIHCLIENSQLLGSVTGPGGLLNKLTFKHVNVDPFLNVKYDFDPTVVNPVANSVSTLPDLHAICAFNYMRTSRWAPAKDLTIAETMIPGHPDVNWLEEAEARHTLRSVVNEFGRETALADYEAARSTIPLYTTPPAAGAAAGAGPIAKNAQDIMNSPGVLYKTIMPASLLAKLDAARHLTFATPLTVEEAAWVLGVIGSSPNNTLMSRMREALCEFVIAMCRQGNCTDRWLRNAVGDLSANFGDSLSIETDRVRAVYSLFSNAATEATMTRLETIWMPKVAVTSVKMKTIMNQAKNQGLTGLTMICEAMRDHPNFNWAGVLDVIGSAEFDAMVVARTAAGQGAGRPYIGYDKQFMDANGMKHYRKLAWVAREVLKNAGGTESLALYKGLPENIPEAAAVRASIQTYVQGQALAVPAVASAASTALFTSVNRANFANPTSTWTP